MEKLVYGVGNTDGLKCRLDGKRMTPMYTLWSNMLSRCYGSKTQARQPTYRGCEVSENFKSFKFFTMWCQEQIGFGKEGYALDKDLLVKGNKVYSEDTCVFLPKEINNALLKRDDDRGKCLIGVDFLNKQNKFRSRLNVNGISKHLGYFKTEIEAFNAYKIAKENYLKELAEKWKDKIDTRAYNALMNYQVEITD